MARTLSQETVHRVQQMLQRETLTQAEVDEFLVVGRLAGPVPVADGFDESGAPFWYTRNIKLWADEPGRTRVRRDGDGFPGEPCEGMQYRRGGRPSKSFDKS